MIMRYQVSLRTIFIVIAATALFMTIGRAIGFATTARWTAVTLVLAVIGWNICRPGPKEDALISLISIATMYAMFFWWSQTRNTSETGPDITWAIAQNILFASWFCFAALAVKKPDRPGRVLGTLSLLLICSPYILLFLDNWQYLLCTMMDLEWQAFRPFFVLYDWLWDGVA